MKSQPKNPKILYVITQGVWGGAQRYVFDLSNEISQNLSVSIAVGEPNSSYDLQIKLKKNPKIDLYQLTHLRRAINPYHDFLAIVELRSLYKKLQPGIVHLNSSKAGIIGSIAAIGLKNKPKIIYTVHGWVFHESWNWFIKNLYLYLEKLTAHFKDAIIVLSPEEKNDGKKILNIRMEKLFIIHLGIEKPDFLLRSDAQQKMEAKAGLKNRNNVIIGTIANLYKNKGLDILIAAANIVYEKNPNAHFFIIGSGPEEKNLRNLINVQKNNNVHLLGNYDNAAQLLLGFDLFVLPSRKEGVPYTILEAMAAGLPIVATAVGGLPGLKNNYKQLELVDPNNKTSLANAITQNINYILSNKKSIYPTHYLEDSSLSQMIKETNELYNKLFRSSRTGG